VKNNEETVKKAIESILNQDFPDKFMEIIVVDGESKDKTLSIVMDSVLDNAMKVKIYSDGGKGLSEARQIVVNNAEGEYIVWVDGDVVVPKDFVRKQVEFMEQNPRVGIAVGKFGYKEGTLVATLQSLRHYTGNRFTGNDATICRIEALRQVGGFDIHMKGACEDLDLMTRIKARGWALSVNEKAKFYHACKEAWRDLWTEQNWFGYGGHYVWHKHKGLFALWDKVPLLIFLGAFKKAVRAYKMMHQKKSFLIPLAMLFENIAWWFGFAKAHMDNYGHN